MRFKADGPAIPDILLDERDAGNVVFLCGAGVSRPAGMPNFRGLADHVIKKVGLPSDSRIRQALATLDETGPAIAEWSRPSLDWVFQRLYDEYGRDQVVKIVWKKLKPPKSHRHHRIVARLSANAKGEPQIVTTNFDHLFEAALGKQGIRRYEPPMYPDLQHGVPATGITYLHGRLAAKESGPHNYILSSADLGRAYLAEGWAAKFVRDLLQRYTVVLLGYQADDPPVSYLLQGLESVARQNPDRLFAFYSGDPEGVDAKWKARHVHAIPYGDNHDTLWETLEAWAVRADNPTSWRSSVVETSRKGPRALKPHERGMVAHVVKTAVGAKEFANGDPGPPAEWLCVFDAACRFAEPGIGFGENRPFDPLEAYRLDNDPVRPRGRGQRSSAPDRDLISWRPGDESADGWQGLSHRRGPRHAPLPPRLFHLAGWLASCVTEPIVAWWVARQPALHPHLHRMLKWVVDGSPGLTDGARRGWMVLLDALESRTPHPVDVALYDLPDRIRMHGWTAGLIREFETLTEPVYDAKPPMTLAEPRPPSGHWSNLKWRTVADLRIRFPPRTVSWPPVPDADVRWVCAALERNLMRTSQRFREIGTEVRDHDRGDRNTYVGWFRTLLDRLSTFDPDRVKQHIALWPDPDPHIFDRLRLRVWSNSSLFSGTETADHILALSDDQFWRERTDRREVLSLLSGRWDDLPAEGRRLIGRRLLNGPPQLDEDEEANGARRQETAATCFGWVVQAGCALPDDLVDQWKTLKGSLSRWDDSWVEDAVATPQAQGVRDVEINEDASVLKGVPVGEIVPVSMKKTEHTPFGVNEPFTGLVKTQPGRAICALSAAARRGEFSAYLWSSALRHWPDTAPPRATRELHGQLRHLPSAIVVAMPYPVGNWLKERFPDLVAHDRVLAYEVFDHLVESLLTTGAKEPERRRTKPIDPSPEEVSRPTYQRAINAPTGKAVEGLLRVLKRNNPEQKTRLPEDCKVRLEKLLSASGERGDDVVCVLSNRIEWLNWIDPGWVDANMIPWFGPDHDRFEPAWNGILSNWKAIGPLFGTIRGGFVALPSKMYEWGWRTATERFCEQIVLLALSDGMLPFEDAHRCLRQIRPEGHEHVIWFLGRVGAEEDDGWQKLVMPFIRNAWPKERRYRTSGTSGAWLSLLCDTDDAFPDVLDAVWNHLCDVDWRQAMLAGAIESLAQRFPRQTLDLLDRVAPDEGGEVPYGLSTVLDLLVEAEPALIGDTRYSRLHRLAARQ